MHQRPKILIAEPKDFSPRALAILQRAAEVELRSIEHQQLRDAFEHYDCFWFRLGHTLDRSALLPDARCRIIATPVTGLNHIDLDRCAECGIEVVSLRGEVDFLRTVRATAELTLALTLALLRHLPRAAASVEAGNWNREEFRGRELFGKTAGIVGVGRLGSIVASYFNALGLEVIGYDTRAEVASELAIRWVSLDDLFAQADIVSVHVSYNATTRALIGNQQFARLKPGAVLINTSRGGVIDETALLAALETGALAGAALDVLADEPNVGRNHPLVAYARDHDNLLILPHLGGNTFESFEKTESFLAERVLLKLSNRKGK